MMKDEYITFRVDPATKERLEKIIRLSKSDNRSEFLRRLLNALYGEM